jgi:Tol biopolymer transport system component/serine/threonine protein kinase
MSRGVEDGRDYRRMSTQHLFRRKLTVYYASMALPTGTRLGPYEIVAALGAGGMGEVYKARDTRLDRMVAIKILPADKVINPDRKLRFIQEAKAASALNHPHIVTIHDISNDNGIDFIVMEYVPGKSLEQLISGKGMRTPEALKYAIQIADAFAAAHAAGIVHRDLKPANVMVTDEGKVKVLDFGLAKLTAVAITESDATLTALHHTEEGAIVGTIAYMSPEQAEGKAVDARSDIFSFGTVVYEVLTGQKAFSGESKLSTMSAILREEPKPLAQLVPDVPRELEKIVQRCLRKDRDRRFQSMSDLKVALQDVKDESESGVTALPVASAVVTTTPRKSRLPIYGAMVAIALVAAGGMWWKMRPTDTPPRTTPFTSTGTANYPAFSADGKLIAYSAAGADGNVDIYVQQIGAGTPLRLTTDAAPDVSPVFSPDGRYIAFTRRATIILIPSLGGAERELGGGILPDFSPDGKTLAIVSRESATTPIGIFLLSVDTGQKKRLTSAPTAAADLQPRFSPDGRTIAFDRSFSAQSAEVDTVPVSGGDVRKVAGDNRAIEGIAWMPDGSEVIYSTRRLGRPQELWRVKASGGTPRPVAGDSQNAALPAVSRTDMRLAYVRQTYDENIWQLDLTDGKVSGGPTKLIASTWQDNAPQYSPDGKKISFASDRSGSYEIWISNANGSGTVQLTTQGGHAGTPRWSPDGRRIAFDASIGGNANIFVIDAGGGAPRQVTATSASGDARSVPSWSSDEKWIYFASNQTGNYEIWRVPVNGGASQSQLTHQGGFDPRESPDGKQLYYLKRRNDSEIWKVSPDGGAESPVSTDPAAQTDFAWWQPFNDGIYFVSRVPKSSPVTDQIQFLSFTTKGIGMIAPTSKPVSGYGGFSVSPDRQHIIFAQIDQDESDIMLVENFR